MAGTRIKVRYQEVSSGVMKDEKSEVGSTGKLVEMYDLLEPYYFCIFSLLVQRTTALLPTYARILLVPVHVLSSTDTLIPALVMIQPFFNRY